MGCAHLHLLMMVCVDDDDGVADNDDDDVDVTLKCDSQVRRLPALTHSQHTPWRNPPAPASYW